MHYFFFFSHIRRYCRDIDIFVNFPDGKAVSALKKANPDTNGAVKASLLIFESTQVTHVAQQGKPRAKTGRNIQTNSTSDHRAGESGLAVNAFRLSNKPYAAQWHVFQAKLRAMGAFRYP